MGKIDFDEANRTAVEEDRFTQKEQPLPSPSSDYTGPRVGKEQSLKTGEASRPPDQDHSVDRTYTNPSFLPEIEVTGSDDLKIIPCEEASAGSSLMHGETARENLDACHLKQALTISHSADDMVACQTRLENTSHESHPSKAV